MKAELELKDEEVKEMVKKIIAFEDAYKLIYPYLSASSRILKELDEYKTQLRMDFQHGIWEHSNREIVAINLFKNLEFGIRSGRDS